MFSNNACQNNQVQINSQVSVSQNSCDRIANHHSWSSHHYYSRNIVDNTIYWVKYWNLFKDWFEQVGIVSKLQANLETEISFVHILMGFYFRPFKSYF